MSILQLNQVSLQLPHSAKPILNNLNYQMNTGDFVILLGRNGSGKSSLLKLLTKQYRPTAGELHLFGKPITACNVHGQVVMLNQHCEESLFPSLTLYENYLLIKQHTAFFTSHSQERHALSEMLLDFNSALATKLDLPVNRQIGRAHV